jgi:hypothetical protein
MRMRKLLSSAAACILADTDTYTYILADTYTYTYTYILVCEHTRSSMRTRI